MNNIFLLFYSPQASEPGLNFNISKLVYVSSTLLLRVLTTEGVMCSLLLGQPS